MSDLNQCNFIGRLGDNPQIRTTQSGEAMATFSIAVSEKWNDKQGNRQERTEWVNIQAFGKLAEIMGQYLQKGSQVFISGKLQNRKYTGQDMTMS
ncbi:MAG: single-stranded DNA-binding protein [Moraxella sp.]|nr:single-stranded DNA-binding protein [Moraxella sp.]